MASVRAALPGPGWELGPVALSDEEQRRLDEIERSLRPDAKVFRVGLRGHVKLWLAGAGEFDDARQRRRVAACTVVGVGVVVLLTGLLLTQSSAVFGVVVAVVGVLIMTGASSLFLRHGRHR